MYRPSLLTDLAKWQTQNNELGCGIVVWINIMLHCHHCHCHYLCTVILVTSLMGTTSYVACILAYFPHQCISRTFNKYHTIISTWWVLLPRRLPNVTDKHAFQDHLLSKTTIQTQSAVSSRRPERMTVLYLSVCVYNVILYVYIMYVCNMTFWTCDIIKTLSNTLMKLFSHYLDISRN